jgi:hypothetical protein
VPKGSVVSSTSHDPRTYSSSLAFPQQALVPAFPIQILPLPSRFDLRIQGIELAHGKGLGDVDR